MVLYARLPSVRVQRTPYGPRRKLIHLYASSTHNLLHHTALFSDVLDAFT